MVPFDSTLDLDHLVSRPESFRDEGWESAFFSALLESHVQLDDDRVQIAPDGWPYLFVRSGQGGSEPVIRILDQISDRGIGLVVNGHKLVPDYVFTFGMLWNFRETGQFISQHRPQAEGKIEFSRDQKLIMGPPTEKYLPLYVRACLREYLQAQGAQEPRILVVTDQSYSHADLCFSIESLGHPEPQTHRQHAERIGWFLPTHYSIVFVHEGGGLPAMHPL